VTSWTPNLLQAGKPKYLALADAIEADIAAGRLRAGDRLPPQRELASAVEVTIATVTKAIGEATRRGLVTGRPGSGTFVRAASPGPAFPTSGAGTDLSLNSVPESVAKPFLDRALVEIAGAKQAGSMFGYQAASGTERHRAAMARWLTDRGLSRTASDIALTHGAQHALAACFSSLTRPGETVLVEAWTYTGIRRLAGMCNVRLAGVAMDENGLVPGDLADKLQATQAKLVMCSSTVQNPTTATMSLERRREILGICKRHDAIIVEDGIYGVLAGDEGEALASLDPARVVYVGSLSKCIAPGFRLGALASPPELLPLLQDALVNLHWTAPSFFAELFAHLLEAGDAERCLIEHRREMERRLAIAAEYLGADAVPALPSYHLWMDAPSPWRLEEFASGLLGQGIRISPSTHFAAEEGWPASPCFRVCLGGIEDEVILARALKEVGTLLSNRPRMSATII
jgi:DNA-binding transcriptional MocR family regulator